MLRCLSLFLFIYAGITAEATSVVSAGCRIDTFTVTSPSMGREIRAVVVLPPAYLADDSVRLPVLFALHGRKAPYTAWSDMAPLKQALATQPMIVACFDGDEASWYLDSPEKPNSRFTTFFFDEFVPHIDGAYRSDPQRRGITGFSMGGFGAVHFMLTKPGYFTAVSTLSGAFNHLGELGEEPGRGMTDLLGTPAEHPERYRSLSLYERVAAQAASLPPLYLHCGTEDRYIEEHRRFTTHLASSGVPAERLTTLATAGKHDWAFWRDASAGVIAFHAAAFTAGVAPRNP